MTKATGIGRGGWRPGAGRRPKAVDGANRPKVVQAAEASVRRIAGSEAGPASALVSEAYAALRAVMNGQESPSSRVSAAKAIIALAQREQAEMAWLGPALGKKEAAAKEAETAGVGSDWGDDLGAATVPN